MMRRCRAAHPRTGESLHRTELDPVGTAQRWELHWTGPVDLQAARLYRDHAHYMS